MIEKINYRGWTECYKIYNETTEIIVVAESGGRIMSYSLHGKNIIYENRALDGLTLKTYKQQQVDPDGGRFDWGPEKKTRNIHDKTWMGDYTAEIVDKYTLRITSPDDEALGIRTIREFSLDSASSYVAVKNTMVNISEEITDWFYWSRTLVKKGGTIVLPLNDNSRFPHGWGKYIWGDKAYIEFQHPEDDQLSVKNNTIVYEAQSGSGIKIGTDSDKGWMAYLRDDLLFVKKYPHFPNEKYSEDSSLTSIFYIGDHFVELEPLSPQAILQPGESYSFTEHWWIFQFQCKNKEITISEIKKYIHEKVKNNIMDSN
ncbi:MAG: DUF4380 domain-containing protein [Bacteroidetes bacterium]|jgi:hypothetical protein|nr:DUF4380 domain-containing protein [Bacteroidota bacterium]